MESGKIPAPSEVWSHFNLGPLEELTKLAAVLAVFAYATGVIAINTYLHGLGIVDFSFAKPKLLLTGIMVLTSFLLLAVPPFFCAWSFASKRGQTWRDLLSVRRVLILIFSFLCVLLLIAVPLYWRGRPGMGQATVWAIWKWAKTHGHLAKPLTALFAAWGVYIPIFVGMVCVYWGKRLFDEERSELQSSPVSRRRFYLLLALAFFVVSTIGYICVFTYTFYSVIPQEFGGGEPYFQSFAVAKEDRCQLQQLGIVFDEINPSITKALPVLHETDTVVAVWRGDATDDSPSNWTFKVVELDKKLISATRVDDEEDNSSSSSSPPPCKD